MFFVLFILHWLIFVDELKRITAVYGVFKFQWNDESNIIHWHV